jgi:hypothetical protein
MRCGIFSNEKVLDYLESSGVLEFWGLGVLGFGGFGVLAFWRFVRKVANLKNLKTSKL